MESLPFFSQNGCHGNVPWDIEKRSRSIICTTLSLDEKIVKIGSVDPEIICLREIIKQEEFEKCWAHSPLRAVLHCHSPGVANVVRRHCRTPPAHRCPRRQRRQQRQRVTEGTAMAPWNGPKNKIRKKEINASNIYSPVGNLAEQAK